MGLPVEINPLFVSSTAGYTVGRSLRFRSSASAYLNRTPSASSRVKFTFSAWVKRGALGINAAIFDAYSDASNYSILKFSTSDTLLWYNQNAAVETLNLTTTQVLRDPSAWYHIVVNYDSAQATSTNRAAMYINGVQVTAFGTATYPSQNTTAWVNAAVAHDIGRYGGASNYFDGYLAEVNFIDGQALTPSSFGAYDTNGVWQPLKYGGTYGTNGFYLPFSNTTSTTTLVQDSSGNGNNWTPNNISLTAGTTYDSMIDSPTVSASSSNYAVWSPIDKNGGTPSDANLTTTDVGSDTETRATFGVSSGKWYYEFTFGATGAASAYSHIGVGNSQSALLTNYLGSSADTWSIFLQNGNSRNNGSSTAYGSGFAANDVGMVAFDMDNGKIWWGKNGTWFNSGNPASGTNAGFTNLSGYTVSPAITPRSTVYNNFGQRPFTYTPPTGYSALNTYNLPTPTIKNGAAYMAATLYTGNGSTQSISNGTNNTLGITFQPDLVWVKTRVVASSNALFDSVRGATKVLVSNSTNAEANLSPNGVSAFNSGGFSVTDDSAGNNYVNGASGGTYSGTPPNYVAWNWKAGGTGVTNNSGSITSTVSANTTAGFSILTFTSTTGTGSVGHGLGVAPSFAILKNRSTTGNWGCYHTSLGNNQYINLNSTSAAATSAGSWATSSTTMSIDQTNLIGSSGTTCVLYCFAAVQGYSAFGSYTGNGSTDGTFVYTGFRPRWIMVKRSDGVESWLVWDSSRSTYNLVNTTLFPNLANDEGSIGTNITLDILSNGFKLRNSTAAGNISSATYVYAAFAENPFNYSRAR